MFFVVSLAWHSILKRFYWPASCVFSSKNVLCELAPRISLSVFPGTVGRISLDSALRVMWVQLATQTHIRNLDARLRVTELSGVFWWDAGLWSFCHLWEYYATVHHYANHFNFTHSLSSVDGIFSVVSSRCHIVSAESLYQTWVIYSVQYMKLQQWNMKYNKAFHTN